MSSFIQNQFEQNIVTTSVDYVFNWARESSIWPLTFGLACCAIEMIAASTSRFDIARFGAEVFRPSPRQSDLMIVAGTVTLKMAPVLKRIWDQMPDPKWCISMGACSSVGGPFNTYAVLQGVDKIVPVDVYITGCPPRPENLFYGLLKLQDKIDQMTTLVKRPTEVRLDESMLADFKQQIRIAQIQNPAVNRVLQGFPPGSTASPNWMRLPWLVHGFGTRHADIPARFAQSRHAEADPFGGVRGRRGPLAACSGEGDALLENTPGAVVAVKTADCIPDPAGGRAPARRGGGACRMARHGGAHRARRGGSHAPSASARPRDLHAAIGPASGSAATRWARKWRRSSESRAGRTSTWPTPTAANC